MTHPDAATLLALAEASVQKTTKEYLRTQGVKTELLEKPPSARSTDTILIKALPTAFADSELRDKFPKELVHYILPPTRTVAIVQFRFPNEASAWMKTHCWTNFKGIPIRADWAPEDLIGERPELSGEKTIAATTEGEAESTMLYIKNLNFGTQHAEFQEFVMRIAPTGFKSCRIVQKDGRSIGYGFVEYTSAEAAGAAKHAITSELLDGHTLQASFSKSKAVTSQNVDEAGGKGAKLLIKNLAFETTSQEIRVLFGSIGSLKSVRIPKKPGKGHRGFGFVEYLSAEDAARAISELGQTHLLGRRLVIEWASGTDDLTGKSKKDLDNVRQANSLVSKKRIKLGDYDENNDGLDYEAH